MRSSKLAWILACWLSLAVGTARAADAETDPIDVLPPRNERAAPPPPLTDLPKDALSDDRKKEADERAAEIKKDADDKAAVDAQAAEEKAEAEKRITDDKLEAQKKLVDEKAEAEKKAADERADAEKKLSDEKKAAAAEPGPPPPAPGRGESAPIASGSVDGSSVSGASQRYFSPMHFGLDIQYSPTKYKELALDSTGTKSDKVAQSGHLTFEWIFFKDLGKFGLGFGFGVSVLSGVQVNPTTTSDIYVYPLELSISYRFDYVRHQILVPYVRAGGDLTIVPFKDADATGFKPGGTYKGVDLAVGLELGLYFIAKHDTNLLDRAYGINDTYIVVEYLKSTRSGSDGPNLARDEIRIGMRFEF